MARASIIIPVRQRTRFLRQTVESTLAQTYRDCEVITVADGYPDAVAEALAPYADRIRLLTQQPLGSSAARNHGARAATGEYLLFLDSDDLIDPQKVERHVALLDARPDVGLSYSGWTCIDEHGRILGQSAPQLDGSPLRALLLRTFCLSTVGAVVLRRDAFEAVGGFDELSPVGADLGLWLGLANAGVAFAAVEGALIQYRIHRDSISNAIATPADIDLRIAKVTQFFARPDLRPEAVVLRQRAICIAHLENAARCYRDGQTALGRELLHRAVAVDPEVLRNTEWLLEFVAGSAIDVRTTAPDVLIDELCGNLPLSPAAVPTLRRRARARYHCVAAFDAYRRSDWAAIRSHARDALRRDTGLFLNRGLLVITARALMHLAPHMHR